MSESATVVFSLTTDAVEVVGASVFERSASDEVLGSGVPADSTVTLTVQKIVKQPQSATLPPAVLHAACCSCSSGKRPRLQAWHGNFNSCARQVAQDRL